VRSGRGPSDTHLLRPWHRRASLQWLHLWLHSLVISKAREWSRPGLDLPILLRWSPLIGGTTTLKACSSPRTRGTCNTRHLDRWVTN
jgi:hypothetical protein